MIVRQPKRWCDECKQTVFSREHGHRSVVPPREQRERASWNENLRAYDGGSFTVGYDFSYPTIKELLATTTTGIVVWEPGV